MDDKKNTQKQNPVLGISAAFRGAYPNFLIKSQVGRYEFLSTNNNRLCLLTVSTHFFISSKEAADVGNA